MCGRYYVDDDILDEIENIVQDVERKVHKQQYGEDIHPMDLAPIIVFNGKNLSLTEKRWGYPGIQKNGIIFNARAESVQEKSLFAKGISRQRSVIPATLFYEWNRNKEKNTFRRLDDKILLFAGFHDILGNEERFVILTTAANSSMIPVHNRMPLILEENQLHEWLQEDSSTDRILRQAPVELRRSCEYEQQTLLLE